MLRICLLITLFIPAHLAQAQKDCLQKELKNEVALMQFDQALRSLNLLYANDKESEYYLLTSAYCYENLGQSKKAQEQYEALILVNDSHNIAKVKLAQCLDEGMVWLSTSWRIQC